MLRLKSAILLARVELQRYGDDGDGSRELTDLTNVDLAALSELSHQFGGVALDGNHGEKPHGVILCRFPTADQAMMAALHLVETLAAETLVGYTEVSTRIGVIYGRFLETRDQVVSNAACLLDRLVAAAEPGQIVATDAALQELSPVFQERLRDIEVPAQVSEIEGDAVSLFNPGDHVQAVLRGAGDSPLELGYRLQLTAGGESLEVSASSPTIAIGRSRKADIVMRHKTVSRIHARVEHRLGKFLFIDMSTNGSFLRLQDGKEVYIRHQELPLWGSGSISLGAPLAHHEALIHFAVVLAPGDPT